MKKFLVFLLVLNALGVTGCRSTDDSVKETWQITFNAGGGFGGQAEPLTAAFDKPMPQLNAEPPTREQYAFTGYFDAQTGGIQYYTADLSSLRNWDKKEDTVLYAQWALIQEGVPALDSSIVSLLRAQPSITNASQLTFEDIKALVEEAISIAGGLEGIVKYGDTVVLKPNLITTIYGWAEAGESIPETVNGVCTDWRVVKAAAQIVREIVGPKGGTGSGKILIMEGSGKGSTQTHFSNAGYTAENLPEADEIIALENEGTWDDSENSSYVTGVHLDNYLYKTGSINSKYKNNGVYYVNKKMYEADALICMPVIKNHWNAVVTGAIKNISIGASPPRVYGNYNFDVGRNNMVNHDTIYFHQWIADYYSCLPADFVIMDGLQGCENGPLPGNGFPGLQAAQKNLRVILASKDALAIDTVETNIINWNYETVKYLEYLSARGNVGMNPAKPSKTVKGDPKDITVLGNAAVDDIRTNFAGNLPMAGGDKLTAAQLAPPVLTIISAHFEENRLMLNLNVSSNTSKIDIYINNVYKASVNENFGRIVLDASEINSGANTVMVRSYTKFMAHAQASITANKTN